MSTYKIRYTEDLRNDVITIVKDFSNDILIDTMDDDGVVITIESEYADDIYNRLLEEVGRKVYARKWYKKIRLYNYSLIWWATPCAIIDLSF